MYDMDLKKMAERVASAGPSLKYLKSYPKSGSPGRLAELWSLEMPGKVKGRLEFEAYWDGDFTGAFAGWNLSDLAPSLGEGDLETILRTIEAPGPQDKAFFKK